MATIEKLERRKLCWNCEGSVSRSAPNCPYCGVYLHPEEDASDEDDFEQKITPPPYQIRDEEEQEEIPQAPYKQAPQQESAPHPQSYKESTGESWKTVVIPLSLLMSGSLFLMFGIMMFLFSHHGYFTVRWDASYWYIYTLVALPLVYLGWYSLGKSE